MSDRIDRIISEVLRREGWPKYTNHPADRGGPTKGGITLDTLRRWRGKPVTARDVETLGEDEARLIYRQRYVVEPGYAGIDDERLKELVVDSAVLFGADDASPWLQEAANTLGAGLRVDGSVGPKTLRAVNGRDARRMYLLICGYRMRKLGRIVTQDARARGRTEDQALNAAGWCNRLADFLEA